MAGRLLSAGRRLLTVADALPVTVLAFIGEAGSFTHIRNTAAQHSQAGPQGRAVLYALARQTLGLPSPVIRFSPAQNALQLTNLPTWLWINPAEWVPESKTATVPGESVTATATPV